MAVFHYESLDERGKKRKGFIEASSELEAKQRLREQSILVTKIGSGVSSKGSKQKLTFPQLLTFTTMLHQLLSAGIPLYESLVAIEEQVRNEPYHRIILSLTEQVKAGSTLSGAMRSFPESFNKLYIAMVGAGEASGNLDPILERLSYFLTKQAKLKKQITNALIYPSILALFALAVIALLMGFVVPSLEGIFQGRELNSYTQFVLSLSQFLRSWWWLFIPAVAGIVTWGILMLRKPKGKLWMEKNLMKLPVIKTLMAQAALVRFTRTLSSLQKGGLPLIESLGLSREVMQNVILEEVVEKAEKRILEGGSLSSEFRKSPHIPQMAVRMIAVGEETGHMEQMLEKVADMYEEELEKTVDRAMTLIQPAILIVMGMIIGMVLLAVLLPMTDITSFTTTS